MIKCMGLTRSLFRIRSCLYLLCAVCKFPMGSHIYVFFLLRPLLFFTDVCVFFAKNVETVDWADTEPEFTLSTHWIIQVKYGVRSPKFIWAPCAQLYSLAEAPQPPPPAFGLIYECSKIDSISLWPPAFDAWSIGHLEIILLLYFAAAT